MGKRKLSPNELQLVAFKDDLDADGMPTKLHIVRHLVGSKDVSRTPCGKGDTFVYPYPFMRWLLERAPICGACKRITATMIEGAYEDWFGDPSSNTGQNSQSDEGKDVAE